MSRVQILQSPKNAFMGNELKWLLKVGVFSRVVIKYAHLTPHTSHAVSLHLFAYSFGDSALPLLSCACLHNNSKWYLPSFVSPSSCIVLLIQVGSSSSNPISILSTPILSNLVLSTMQIVEVNTD